MWRYLAGAAAALALAGAGVMLFSGHASPRSVLPAAPLAAVDGDDGMLPDTVPAASAKTREQKRFGRYDKDRDGSVTRDEYLQARRKAFAKLDRDGNGQLSFDEWAVKATTKFAGADRDKSGAMNAAEFATTAVKRKKTRVRVNCPPAGPTSRGDEQEG